MHDPLPFIIEGVIVLSISILLLLAALRQVHHDYLQNERWRPLIVCHYLIAVTAGIQAVNAIDPQGGLGTFSQSFIFYLRNMKSMLLIAAARALAAAFVGSYELIVSNGNAQQSSRNRGAFIVHALFMILAVPVFTILFATRRQWLGVASEIIISLYSILVGTQVVVSAYKVRRILLQESKKTGRYKTGIRKLTRVIVLVVFVVIVGNASLVAQIISNVESAKDHLEYPEDPAPFNYSFILVHLSALVALAAVMLGGWKISETATVSGTTSDKQKKRSRPSTTHTSSNNKGAKGLDSPMGTPAMPTRVAESPSNKTKQLEAMPLDNV